MPQTSSGDTAAHRRTARRFAPRRRVRAVRSQPDPTGGQRALVSATSATVSTGGSARCPTLRQSPASRCSASCRGCRGASDVDPYRRRVASAFGNATASMFGPIAEERAELRDFVQSDVQSGAHFIAAPNERDLRLLLNSGGFARLIEEARRAYDIVILDTPPVRCRLFARPSPGCSSPAYDRIRGGSLSQRREDASPNRSDCGRNIRRRGAHFVGHQRVACLLWQRPRPPTAQRTCHPRPRKCSTTAVARLCRAPPSTDQTAPAAHRGNPGRQAAPRHAQWRR
jgi:hypothetical protein